MAECNHDCSSCSSNCSERKPESFLKELNPYSSVKKVIAVVSGKGGVGKSLVTSLLASEMQRRGHSCAVLDADITGPSIPKSFGIHEHATGTEQYLIPVTTQTGLQVMSINLILENETEPVVWRGPVIAGAVTQFWTDVLWRDVDYMFVDMPPGTGDVPLTVFVENMSYFTCPDCGKKHEIFGASQADSVAKEFDIAHVARLPIDPNITAMVDAGQVEQVSGEYVSALVDSLEQDLPLEEEA